MIKLLVFDWDGTIGDSIARITQAKHQCAHELGLTPPSESVIRSVLGQDITHAFSCCFPEADWLTLQQCIERFQTIMQQQADPLFDQALAILEQLQQHYILSIATAKPRTSLQSNLDFHNMTHLFQQSICSQESLSKPHPAMLNTLMQNAAAIPSETVMIGDSCHDIQMAHNAGVKTIAVSFGSATKQQLQTTHPDTIIDHWSQLPQAIQAL